MTTIDGTAFETQPNAGTKRLYSGEQIRGRESRIKLIAAFAGAAATLLSSTAMYHLGKSNGRAADWVEREARIDKLVKSRHAQTEERLRKASQAWAETAVKDFTSPKAISAVSMTFEPFYRTAYNTSFHVAKGPRLGRY